MCERRLRAGFAFLTRNAGARAKIKAGDRPASLIDCSPRLDRDDFGSNRPKALNVIDSNRLERDAGEKVLTLFLAPL
jgi:hypothetical protein